MEERLIDKDESRKIKIKHTAEGEDVVDALAPDGEEGAIEEEEADYIVELPEEDEQYDEDLVGLTPSQLQARMEAKKRAEERARAEYEKLMGEANAALGKNDLAAAEPLFAQASLYECDDGTAKRGLWHCRTQGYQDIEVFTDPDAAHEFYWAEEEVRAEVLGKLEGRIRERRDALLEEIKPLRTSYEREQAVRAEAFGANRRYYLLRTLIVLAVVIALAVGAAVSATYILKRGDSLPLILTIVFAALAVITLVVFLIYLLKTVNAARMCRANEKLSSTDAGMRLAELDERVAALTLALGEAEEEE